MTTLLLCELSEIVATGIEVVVKKAACKVLACCRSSNEVLRIADLLLPDMIIASSSALGDEALATIRMLRAENRHVQIIILIDTDARATAANLAEFEVDGLLLRHASSAALLECINSVQQGRPWLDPELLNHLARHEHTTEATDNLTAREREVMHLVALGMSNKEIAREAKLTEGTVKMYLHHILAKLRLGNRTQLATYAHARSAPPPARHSPDQASAPASGSHSLSHSKTLAALPMAQPCRERATPTPRGGMAELAAPATEEPPLIATPKAA